VEYSHKILASLDPDESVMTENPIHRLLFDRFTGPCLERGFAIQPD
jgi:hypothetical protein